MAKHSTPKKQSVKQEIVVLPFESGEMVQLGGGSFSNLLLTKASVSKNKTMMGYSVFKPGIDTKQKVHLTAEELAYVVSGSGKITIGEKIYPFRQNDSLFIPRGVPHGVRNDGMEDVVMVFFFSTPSYPKTIDA
ncbi:MAG: cupin domain-containing protein [Nitrososphaerota archaeon]|nr:cupin domain-containing protein [Nitrososphaerota archaeon]